MPQLRAKLAELRRWFRRQTPTIRYGSIILSLFLIVVVASAIDWRSLWFLRGADSCPGILGTPSMGTITVTGDVTLNASDYVGGVVDCSETDIVVQTGVTVTLQGYDNGDADYTNDYGVTWNVKSLDVETGAFVSADATGHVATKGTGTGETGTGTTAGGGGGYGGAGGEGEAEVGNPSTEGGATYGQATNPAFMGSGGGNAGSGASGGAGGGFAKIVASGTVTINGKLSADGQASQASASSSGGAGSGGSVFVEAATLAGNGLVQANGGASADVTYRGGGGGGGRVVMFCTAANSFAGNVYANGGDGGLQDGQVGTVIGPTCYPDDPTDSGQYELSVAVENELQVGEATSQTTMAFDMTVSDVDPTDTLYAQVEIAEVGEDFTGTPTATGAGVGYTGTPVVATVTASNLDSSKAYHWRARVRDAAGAVSGWVSFGSNGENENDFVIAGVATTLQKTSGDSQSGPVTTQLADPFVVRVVDGNGLPVPNYDIDWSVLQGGGSVSVTDATTDRNGYAQTYLTLGTQAGSNNNRAQAVHTGLIGSPMVFTASAASDVVDHYEVIAPSAVLINTAFEITVTAKDQYNNTVTTATNDVNLSAVQAADTGTPAAGTLTPSSATLVDGTVTVSNTQHDTEESIKIKASDASANEGFSDTIAVVTSFGSCPDADGIIDTNQTWTASPSNGGVFDCTGINIQVTNGATLTLESYDSLDDIYTNDLGVTVLAASFTVDLGATTTASEKGYHGNGPGEADTSFGYSGGGGYGGNGGEGYGGRDGGEPYGNVYEPTDLGSGNGYAAIAGGAIKLDLTGDLTVNGTLSTNGVNEGGNKGASSGGSLWLIANNVAGTGTVQANGVNSGIGGSGGGGRVAIYYTTGMSLPITSVQAFGGTKGSTGTAAGPGTIYVEHVGVDASHGGKLYVDANGITDADTAGIVEGTYSFDLITLTDYGDLDVLGEGSTVSITSSGAITGDGTGKITNYGTFSVTPTSLTISNAGMYVAGEITGVNDFIVENGGDLGFHAHTPWHAGSYTFNTITVNSGGTVTAVGYDDGDENWIDDYGVTLNLASLTVNTGGQVSTLAQGYGDEKGPGKSATDGGGGHGGHGAKGYWSAGGTQYGDVFRPVTLGSGGGTGTGGCNSTTAGAGGGALHIDVSGALLIDGTINAEGESVSCGGSGGSLWIEANAISGSGSITADGGMNKGGGGRIAYYYTTSSSFPLANITAYGGTGGWDGEIAGAGTIYVKQGVAGGGGDLYVDNQGNNGLQAAITEAGTYEFNIIKLTGYGHLDVTHINSNLVVQGAAGLDGDGTADLTDYGMLTLPSAITIKKVDVGVAGDMTGADTSLTIGEASGLDAGVTLYAHTEKKEGVTYNEFSVGDLTVEATGTLTLVGYDGDSQDVTDDDESGNDDYGVIINASSLDVKLGAEVTASGLGFAYNKGTGYLDKSGGSHGGYGSKQNANVAGGTPYGDVYAPVTIGSGGDKETNGEGGPGGGAVKFNLTGDAMVNGSILAEGLNATGVDSAGGAGGSVWIVADSVSGSGNISVNGGKGGHESYGRCGSGGRVAINYTTSNTFPVAGITAYGGAYAGDSGNGGPGTIYIKQGTGAGGDLYVDNNDRDYLRAAIVDEDTFQFNKITLNNEGNLDVTHINSNLSIQNENGLDGDGTGVLNAYGLLTIPSTFTVKKLDLGVLGDLSGGDVSLTVGEIAGTAGGVTLYAHTEKREGVSYNEYSFGDLTVKATGTMTLVGYDGDDQDPADDDASGNNDYGVILNVDNVTIDTSGELTASSQGFAAESGTGAGEEVSNDKISGGGHGGYGASVYDAAGGVAYGDVYEPITLGSGGGHSTNGGAGGGAIKLVVSQDLTINGTLSADGEVGTDNGAGGAGGSVWVSADAIDGTGNVTANGGNGSTGGFGSYIGAGGAGGRIALYYTTSNGLSSSDLYAYGGINLDDTARTAGPGTVYVKQGTGAGGDLYVDNNDNEGTMAALTEAEDYSFDQITLSGYGDLHVTNTSSTIALANENSVVGDGTSDFSVFGTLTIPSTFSIQGFNLGIAGDYSGGSTSITVGENAGVAGGLILYAHSALREGTTYNEFTFGDITVDNTGTLTMVGYDGDSESSADNDEAGNDDYGVILNVDNLTVASSGTVTANGQGYVAGEGTGQGEDNCGGGFGNKGSGGAHGGYGGYSPETAWLSENFGGDAYGDYAQPVTLGSGGGLCGSATTGQGGGAMKIVVNSTFAHSGSITANGTVPTDSTAGGGGAGGSVWIIADTITGSGTIKTNGALGKNSGDGAGSGGRISIEYTTANSLTSGNTQAYGAGSGTKIGGPGTVFIKKSDENGSLYLDNNDVVGAALADDFEAGDYDLKDVVIDNNVKVTIKGQTELVTKGVVFDLTGDFTVGVGAYLDGEGQGFASSDGPGSGTDGSGGGEKGGGGGAHGGDGGLGDDGADGVSGGSSYGESSNPLTLGSGGGLGSGGAVGGAGGGAFAVYATEGAITIDGTINVDGGNGLTSSPGGGGGAGGSVLLKGDGVVLSATSDLSAEGGSGGDDAFDGGGGAGGRIAILYGESGYTAEGAVSDDPGTGYQSGQEGTTLGPIGYPNAPEDMDQLEPDDMSIPVGGTTPETTVKLKFLASDADPIDTLTPQIEIRSIGTDFTNSATHTGDDLSYTGTPLEAEVSVPGLVLGTSYHWQARVQDDSGVYSSWVSYGGNSEAQADFTVTEATQLRLEPSVDTLTSGGYFTITLSAIDDNEIVDTAYRGTVHFTSSDPHAILPSDYTFTADDNGTHEFINEFLLGTIGDQTITGTDTVDASLTGQATITVVSGGDIDTQDSTVEVSPDTIENDGEESSAITVTLVDVNGDPVIGRTVNLAATGTGNTLTQPVYTTDVDGKAYGSITSTDVGGKVISATVEDTGDALQDTATLTVRDTTPPVISNIQVSNLAISSATISWETNELTTGQVEYGTSVAYGNASDYISDLDTEHSVTLTGLTRGKTYHFRIAARDASLNDALSSDQTFTTLDELLFETFLISDVSVSSALIKWSTNVEASAVLSYGTSEDDLSTSVTIDDVASSHEYTLDGLTRGTTYYVQIKAVAGDLEKLSEVKDFTTLEDENAVRIIDIEVRNVTDDSATVTFGTTKPATIVLKYGKTKDYEKGELTSDEFLTEHSYDLSGLDADTEYHFQIVARDQDGFTTTSPDQTFRTKLADLEDFGIVSVNAKKEGDDLVITWGTTVEAVCVIDYGQSVDYDFTSQEFQGNELNRFEGRIDVSTLDDIEIHYRIRCNDNFGRTAVTRDLVYTSLLELPITATQAFINRLRENPVVRTFTGYVVPGLSLIVILLQALSMLATMGGLKNLTSRFNLLFGAIFDKERKRKGWGIVYDVHRKDPVPFAVVRLSTTKGKLVDETVTDLKGRYRFSPKDGEYTLTVHHPDFVMPEAGSDLVRGMDVTGQYLGGEIEVKDGVTVSYDIPLVSKARAVKDGRFENVKDRLKIYMNKYGKYLNILGGILLVLSLLITPKWWNWVLLALNVALLALMLVIRLMQPKNWGRTFEVKTKRGVKGAFVRLFDEKEKKLINTVMTDENGRYGFLVEKGAYLIVASKPGYKFPGRPMKAKLVESKVLGKSVELKLEKDEVIKRDLPLRSLGKEVEEPTEETPFGA